MRQQYLLIRKVFLLMGLTSLILSTSCTKSLYIKVLKPAQFHVGDHIQSIALVNRTRPQNTKANIIEGLLTGEGLYQDKRGVENAFSGLNYGLRNTPRFQIQQTNLILPGSGSGNSFPAPLQWAEIEKICAEYKADAICVVETFDTDTQIVPTTRTIEEKDKEGNVRKRTEFVANLMVQVKMGFRLYDLKDRSIRDEFLGRHSLSWTGVGHSPQTALATLINKSEATDRVSYVIGEQYAARIAPAWITVEREYYKKGGDSRMKPAFRMAYVNDWDGAARLWEQIVETSGGKTAGKAAYNLAIALEVMGRLDEAKAWTDKAYTMYGNKKARSYSYVLDRRIYDNQRLQNQMKSVANN